MIVIEERYRTEFYGTLTPYKVTEFTTYCPLCGLEMIFKQFPENHCPNCGLRIPFIEQLMDEEGFVVRLAYIIEDRIKTWNLEKAVEKLEEERKEKGAQYHE